jgi:hypothetical protein
MPQTRRLLIALALLISLGACQSGTASATPPCGGFHLRVINQSSGRVNVDVNDTPAVILEPNDEKVLAQYLPPQLPDLPWTVTITRSTDGSEIGNSHFSGGPDRDLFVKDNGLDEKQFAPPTPNC